MDNAYSILMKFKPKEGAYSGAKVVTDAQWSDLRKSRAMYEEAISLFRSLDQKDFADGEMNFKDQACNLERFVAGLYGELFGGMTEESKKLLN